MMVNLIDSDYVIKKESMANICKIKGIGMLTAANHFSRKQNGFNGS
jgi:hypothetical protein